MRYRFESEIESILKMLAEGHTETAVAAKCGVTQSAVNKIKHRMLSKVEMKKIKHKTLPKTKAFGVIFCLLLGYEIKKSRCNTLSHPTCKECR